MRMRWTAIAVTLALLISPCSQAGDSLSPDQLAERLDAPAAPLILDVRSAEEFAAGHIPGAQLIPHDQLAERIDELGAPRELVVYCRSGRRVGLVRDLLIERGFEVRELEGSYQAWQAAELPVTQEAEQ